MRITPAYQAMQRELHKVNKGYGHVAEQYGQVVTELIDLMEIDSVLDYGAGHRMSLRGGLNPMRSFTYQPYDPGVEEMDGEPDPAQLVVCLDVLEHIEPECIESVMDHLEELTQKVLFATICYLPAFKKLPDGRNAHLIQEDMEWWLPKFWERFTIMSVRRRGNNGFEVVAFPKDYLAADSETHGH